ncbi:hypothetical protein RRG08_012077 [Elysia crispata]|uniref:Uncharacterized protein n=1 Tax=Elysia crispata TaxID=231223 RepID=A0AAE1EEW4_9GAST|nr:hypothetical protein RRG08_012077 [Elysia crispata]
MSISILVFHLLFITTCVYGQLVISTSGQSGELCGQYHHCLSNSTCVRSPGKYVCVCQEPLRGNAKLGCVSEKSATVFIQSDPHMKNLYHQFVSVSTPCRYRVMEFFYDHRYVIRVYVDNFLYKGGEFYANSITVRAAVSSVPFTTTPDETMLTWSAVHIIGDTTSIGTYQFMEWRGTETTGLVTPSEQTRFMADGSEIYTEYDEVDNLAMIKIATVGFSMWFRPIDRFALEEGLPCMAQVPGVVISVETDKLAKLQFNETDLSSTPTGPDLKASARDLDMDLDMYAILLTLRNTQTDYSDSTECILANNNFKDVCRRTDKQVKTINVCGHLYTDRKFLSCVQSRNHTFMARIFSDCVQTLCDYRSPVMCEVLKSHIIEFGCVVPKVLEDYDCNSLVQP